MIIPQKVSCRPFAQLRHDQVAAAVMFGQQIVWITLGHNVPYFADIAEGYFERLIDERFEFVPP